MESSYQRAMETALHGMNLVIEELIKRGASVEKADGRANRLIVRSKDNFQPVTVRIKTKGRRSRHWNVSARDGRNWEEPVDPYEFWVLVDLSRKKRSFLCYLWWRLSCLIYDEYERLTQHYLEFYERTINPDATRGTIERYPVEEYEDLWDLLPI